MKWAANIGFLYTEIESPAERIKAAHSGGFPGVELGCSWDKDALPSMVEAKNETETVVYALNTAKVFSPSSDDEDENASIEWGLAALPSHAEAADAQVAAAVEAACMLGAEGVHVLSGKGEECTMDAFVSTLIRVSPLLDSHGLVVLIEPINSEHGIPGYFMDSIDKAVEAVERVKAEVGGTLRMGVQFDVFHVALTHGPDQVIPLLHSVAQHPQIDVLHVQLSAPLPRSAPLPSVVREGLGLGDRDEDGAMLDFDALGDVLCELHATGALSPFVALEYKVSGGDTASELSSYRALLPTLWISDEISE